MAVSVQTPVLASRGENRTQRAGSVSDQLRCCARLRGGPKPTLSRTWVLKQMLGEGERRRLGGD